MAKAWKIISAVCIIAVLLGALCVLVGLITGGDTQRLLDIFNATYNIDSLKQAYEQAIQNALNIQTLG
ncbi:MAG: hypothetical protein MSM72_07610 [Firmicutes bacterium]|nr:hypothetical protein [Bacillota bacterium]